MTPRPPGVLCHPPRPYELVAWSTPRGCRSDPPFVAGPCDTPLGRLTTGDGGDSPQPDEQPPTISRDLISRGSASGTPTPSGLTGIGEPGRRSSEGSSRRNTQGAATAHWSGVGTPRGEGVSRQAVPNGLSMMYRHVPSGPRRATSVAVPRRRTGAPSGPVPSIAQSTMSRAMSPAT